MSEEIEIEFKNMLTEAEYNKLKNSLMQAYDSHDEQINYYFDTANFLLKERKTALRIRKKTETFTFTLKEPHQVGLLETHQLLTESEAMSIISGGPAPNGTVTTKVNNILKNDWSSLNFLGELMTYRLEKKIPEGLLVLDKSSYLNKIDFELEFECSDEEKGEVFFHKTLEKYAIPKRMTHNKVQRFMKEKAKINKVMEGYDEAKLD